MVGWGEEKKRKVNENADSFRSSTSYSHVTTIAWQQIHGMICIAIKTKTKTKATSLKANTDHTWMLIAAFPLSNIDGWTRCARCPLRRQPFGHLVMPKVGIDSKQLNFSDLSLREIKRLILVTVNGQMNRLFAGRPDIFWKNSHPSALKTLKNWIWCSFSFLFF